MKLKLFSIERENVCTKEHSFMLFNPFSMSLIFLVFLNPLSLLLKSKSVENFMQEMNNTKASKKTLLMFSSFSMKFSVKGKISKDKTISLRWRKFDYANLIIQHWAEIIQKNLRHKRLLRAVSYSRFLDGLSWKRPSNMSWISKTRRRANWSKTLQIQSLKNFAMVGGRRYQIVLCAHRKW